MFTMPPHTTALFILTHSDAVVPHTECRSTAVHIHALDACNDPELPFGNHVELRCGECLEMLKAEIAAPVNRLNRIGLTRCAGCGAPVVEVGDVVRAVHEI